MKKQQNANQEQTTNGKEFLQTEPAPEKSFLEMSALIREKFETAERIKTEMKQEIESRIAEKESVVSQAVKEMESAEIAGDIDLYTQAKERAEDAEGFLKVYRNRIAAISAGKIAKCEPGEAMGLAHAALNAGQREFDAIAEEWEEKYKALIPLSVQALFIVEEYHNLIHMLACIDKDFKELSIGWIKLDKSKNVLTEAKKLSAAEFTNKVFAELTRIHEEDRKKDLEKYQNRMAEINKYRGWFGNI